MTVLKTIKISCDWDSCSTQKEWSINLTLDGSQTVEEYERIFQKLRTEGWVFDFYGIPSHICSLHKNALQDALESSTDG